MRIYLDCISCFIRQALDAARHATDDEQIHERVVRGVLDLSRHLDVGQSPPAIGQQIHRLIRDLVGVDDPYHGVKQRFNEVALKMYSRMHHLVLESEDPLETAVRLAVAGNIIDFGVKSEVSEAELEATIDLCLSTELPAGQVDAFREAVREADHILYLADNAGEIVFDRLLIEQLQTEKVTVAVKGSAVINDATMEDALQVGLHELVKVIHNGSDAPGTILESCSPFFRIAFNRANLVIAKGQGNYETLSETDKNIFFLLKAKCSVISNHIGCRVGDMILQKTKAWKGGTQNARI